MTKRLSRQEYLVIYMIILSFACLIGGFFLGASVVQSKMNEQINQLQQANNQMQQNDQLIKEKKLYREQDFTSYYYGFYQPIESFKEDYFLYVANLQGKTIEGQKKHHQDFLKIIQAKLKQLEPAIVSTTSPLLVDAKAEYIASLQTLKTSIQKVIDDPQGNTYTAQDIAAQRHLQAFTTKWLEAQKKMYHAIALWEQIYVLQHSISEVDISSVSEDNWDRLPFHYRNYLSARYMQNMHVLPQFVPHDVTAKIDLIRKKKEFESRGWQNIAIGVNVLIASNSVQAGDFSNLNKSLYPVLKLPEMPLFTK